MASSRINLRLVRVSWGAVRERRLRWRLPGVLHSIGSFQSPEHGSSPSVPHSFPRWWDASRVPATTVTTTSAVSGQWQGSLLPLG